MKEINYLKENGTLGLIAPSFGCTTEPYKTRLEVAINNLKNDGYSIVEGPNIYLAKNKARSNSAYLCAKEFMDMYLSSPADAIISVGGGEIMCEILPYINFKKISKAPHKFFMGFSDNTNLTYTLATIAEVPTIYGPCAPSFAFKPYQYSTLDALNLLTNKTKNIEGYPYWERYRSVVKEENPLTPSNFTEKKELRLYPKKDSLILEGRLIGGCLDCLQVLCGTKYDKTVEYCEKYKEDGIIFFIEACDLSPIAIKRALFQLKEANWFKYVKGFIIGRPLCYKQRYFGINHYQAFREGLKELNVPLIMDADLGHFDPSMPLITGVKAKVEVKNNNIFIDYI